MPAQTSTPQTAASPATSARTSPAPVTQPAATSALPSTGSGRTVPEITAPQGSTVPGLTIPAGTVPQGSDREEYQIGLIVESLNGDGSYFATVTADRAQKLFLITPKDPHMTQQVMTLYHEKYEVQAYWDRMREHFSEVSRVIGTLLPDYTLAYGHPADPSAMLLKYVNGERIYDFTDAENVGKAPIDTPVPSASTEEFWFGQTSNALEKTFGAFSTLSADQTKKRFILISTTPTILEELNETYSQDPDLQQVWAGLREGMRQASELFSKELPGYLLAFAAPGDPEHHLLRIMDGKVIYDYTDELVAAQPDVVPQPGPAMTEAQWQETMRAALAEAYQGTGQVTVSAEDKTFLIVPADPTLAQSLYQHHEVNDRLKAYWTATHTYIQGASREIHKVLPGYRLVFADPQTTSRPLMIYANGILMYDFLDQPDQNPFPNQPGLQTEDYWFQTLLQQQMELDKGHYHIEASKEGKQFRFIPSEVGLVNTITAYLQDPSARAGWTGFVDGFKAVSSHISQFLPGYTVSLANPADSRYDLLKIRDGVVIYDAFPAVPEPGTQTPLPGTRPQ